MATPETREAMLGALPGLRAFAISLTGNRDAADDLVQDAVLRAWTNLDKFEPGSSMSAWLFTILRHAFYSECRKTRREVEDPDGLHAGRLGTPPNQSHTCEFQELLEALAKLSPVLREALILVGAQGMTYEEAAHVTGVPSGTLKSRVSRARARLAQLLAMDDGDDLGPDRITQAALQSAS
jgi:RNA polymerase sigma-70 factor (ECF subfamily)